ncbi:conserved hypothetical protein [Corynebacterium efficiens YS-314]|uniref:Uncharacterized protein n=1 Tax=Corynebacterium efficiens (strain DSM 44549 / YS-314 / AJ 12310 / JCM 11189 / NBRC 100395) TaxID=196164 RepID=Q8FQS8_COREF|nr:conserved hypothetical protein [Corynebacterium efficiens YS-314]
MRGQGFVEKRLALETWERGTAGVDGCVTQQLLDAQQLVVLGHTVGTCRCTGLDLAAVQRDSQIGDGGVLGLTGTVGHHGGVTCAVCHVDGVEGLGEGTDLVDLDQDGVGGLLGDALLQTGRVGDEEVIADDLNLVTDLGGQCDVAIPVVLLQRILDGDDRVLVDKLGVDVRHLLGGVLATLEVVFAVLEELGGSNIQGQGDVLARLEAGLLDGLDDEVQGCTGGLDGRGEAALIAQTGGQALLVDDLLQCVVDLRACAQGLGEGVETDRGDHELLDIHTGVGVCATVDDVHHRDGQHVGVRATDVTEQGQTCGIRGGLGHSHGDTQDGVGAQAGLVLGAVQLDHGRIDETLIVGLQAGQLVADLLVDVLNSLENTLAQVTISAVTQLVRLVDTGGRSGGNAGNAVGTVIQENLCLDGRVTAGIHDLASKYVHDFSHCGLLCQLGN